MQPTGTLLQSYIVSNKSQNQTVLATLYQNHRAKTATYIVHQPDGLMEEP